MAVVTESEPARRLDTAMMAATASAPLLDEDIGCVLFQQVWNGRTMEGEVAMEPLLRKGDEYEPVACTVVSTHAIRRCACDF